MDLTLDWTGIGVLLSAGGLIGLGLSLWLLNKSIRAQMVGRLYGELHHVHQTFIENPKLRPVFFHNQPLGPDDDDYMQARAVAEMYLDIFEHIFIISPLAPKQLRAPLTRYITHMCESSGFLSSYLIENEELLHPRQLLDIVRSAILKEGAKLQPEAPGPT